MLNLASGVWNTALGPLALNHDTNGGANTATGFQAFFYNTAGNQNTAYGAQALYSSRDGNLNTVIGYRALCNGGGNINTANGAYALYNNDDGVGNTRSVKARSLPVVTAAVTRPLVIKPFLATRWRVRTRPLVIKPFIKHWHLRQWLQQRGHRLSDALWQGHRKLQHSQR